jgi:hypothetical protein
VGKVWTDCIDKRHPLWGVLHHRDHLSKAAPGGLPDATAPGGPDPEHIEAWFVEQAKIVFAA